jgi:elongation factor P
MKVNAGNIKKGDFVLHQDDIWQVQKSEFYSPGKGSAVMRTKIKNVVSGKNVDMTYKSQEMIEVLDVTSTEMQYLYKDTVAQSQVEMIHCYMHLTEELVFL